MRVRNGLSFRGGGGANGGAAALPLFFSSGDEFPNLSNHYCKRGNVIVRYRYRTCVCTNSEGQLKTVSTKEQIIQQIVELLHQCNDIPLLDLIRKLLTKSV